MSRTMLGLAITLVFAACAIAQEEQVEDPAVLRAEAWRSVQADTQSLPVVEQNSIRDVLQFRVHDNQLFVQTSLKPTAVRSRMQFAELPDVTMVTEMPDVTVVKVSPSGDGQQNVVQPSIELQHHNFSVPDTIFVHTMIFFGGGNLQISRSIDGIKEDVSIQLIQNETSYEASLLEGEYGIRLYIQSFDNVTEEEKINLTLQAANIVELRRKYPQETTQYLQPIFHDLGQDGVVFAIDPRAAWQVFAADVPKDPKVIQQLKQVIAQFEADDFHQRNQAMDQLEALGQPAAVALMGMSREGLSEEQISRIETFLASYRPLGHKEAEELRTSPGFLLDCLASKEIEIRKLALAALQQVAGKVIEFNVSADTPIRNAAIDKLRAELLPAPATQPMPAFQAGG